MNRDNLCCMSGFNFHHKIQIRNPYVLHRIGYYEGHVKNTKDIYIVLYSLQIKSLTRQGNEDKIRYFYIKAGTSWSSSNYGINQCEIQTTLIEDQLFVGPPTGDCYMKTPPFFSFLFTHLLEFQSHLFIIYCLFYFIIHVYIRTIVW